MGLRAENSHRIKYSFFGCSTPQLLALANWLRECGVTSIALESTGVEWIPLFNILSQHNFQVCLVNAHHVTLARSLAD